MASPFVVPITILIIVGGGLAGSSLAIALAGRGARYFRET